MREGRGEGGGGGGEGRTGERRLGENERGAVPKAFDKLEKNEPGGQIFVPDC